MDVIENKPIYKCEYCSKVSLNKGAMVLHERACGKNPENHMMCSSCTNCIKETKILFIYEPNPYTQSEGEYQTITDFICAKDNKKMYSSKILRYRKEIREKVLARCDKPMPTKLIGCKMYKNKD